MKILYLLSLPSLAALYVLMPPFASFLLFAFAIFVALAALYFACLHLYTGTLRLLADTRAYCQERQLAYPNIDGALPVRRASLASGKLDSVVLASNHAQTQARFGKLQVTQPAAAIAAPAPQQPQPIDLLQALELADAALVCGARGTGKTTLLQTLLNYRRNVHVIDIHATPGKWPGASQVIGSGRDFAAVERALQWVVTEMDARAKRLASGLASEQDFQADPITLLLDEWYACTQKADNAAEVIRTLIAESRKFGIALFLSSQSDRVKSLGLERAGDLKAGLAIVRLQKTSDGNRTATIAMGDEEPKPALLPAPILTQPTPKKQPVITGMYIIPRERWEGQTGNGNAISVMPENEPEAVQTEMEMPFPDRATQAKQMLSRGIGKAEVIKQLWGAETGRKYQQAKQELEAMLAE